MFERRVDRRQRTPPCSNPNSRRYEWIDAYSLKGSEWPFWPRSTTACDLIGAIGNISLIHALFSPSGAGTPPATSLDLHVSSTDEIGLAHVIAGDMSKPLCPASLVLTPSGTCLGGAFSGSRTIGKSRFPTPDVRSVALPNDKRRRLCGSSYFSPGMASL